MERWTFGGKIDKTLGNLIQEHGLPLCVIEEVWKRGNAKEFVDANKVGKFSKQRRSCLQKRSSMAEQV